METRPLGDTGHDSTVMTFGAIALNWLELDRERTLLDPVPWTESHVDAEVAIEVAEDRSDIRAQESTRRRRLSRSSFECSAGRSLSRWPSQLQIPSAGRHRTVAATLGSYDEDRMPQLWPESHGRQ